MLTNLRLIYPRRVPQVRLGAHAKYEVIAVLVEVRFECARCLFTWRCAQHFLYFPCSSASEDARVLGDSSQTCTSVPAMQFWTLPDYYPPSIGRFRVRCGGGVRVRGGVRIRQSDSRRGVIIWQGVENGHNTGICVKQKQFNVKFKPNSLRENNAEVFLHSLSKAF